MAQINKPNEYFNTKLYTGTGSSQAITGVDFQPDMVWIKDRTGTGYHRINDAVRGATKEIYPNVTNAENTEPQAVTSFDTDGFTVGSNNGYSQNGYNFASWNWLGANGTAANTDGSISSTVSANTTSGFSIVSYTGNSSNSQTVGHGLSVAPSMVIIKNRVRSDEGWWTQHTSFADGTYYSLLNSTSAPINTGGNIFNGFPTSTVFKLNNGRGVNESGSGHIAYCFAEKKGFSKFGSYIGNGNTDGTFVYTGFKPAFVIFKRTSGTGNWQLLDNKRLGYNPLNYTLYPNTDTSDQDEGDIYLYSNGFQLRGTGTDGNGSGSTYIYMAFAEQPLVGTNNIPATAR